MTRTLVSTTKGTQHLAGEVRSHRRRKILKVGGAEYPIAREARAKILRSRPLHVKPRPFLHDRGCYHEFLGEKINCKSSRIDLVAIEAYLLIIRPGKCLKIFIVTILGWRTMGALPPFLKYWGGYSPLSPPPPPPPPPPVPTPMVQHLTWTFTLME